MDNVQQTITELEGLKLSLNSAFYRAAIDDAIKLIKQQTAALKGAVGALEFSRDYHKDLGNEEQAFAQDRLDAVTKAIAGT